MFMAVDYIVDVLLKFRNEKLCLSYLHFES